MFPSKNLASMRAALICAGTLRLVCELEPVGQQLLDEFDVTVMVKVCWMRERRRSF